MKKYFILLPIVFTVTTQTMEKNSWLLSISTWWSGQPAQTQLQSERLKGLKQDKQKLDTLLRSSRTADTINYYKPDQVLAHYVSNMYENRDLLLEVVYNNRKQLWRNLENCCGYIYSDGNNWHDKPVVNPTINGYSALGIAAIARTDSLDEKRELIQKLLDLGFEPTKKDKELAYLEYYERTEDDTERKFLSLLLSNQYHKSDLPALPMEVVVNGIWPHAASDEQPLQLTVPELPENNQ